MAKNLFNIRTVEFSPGLIDIHPKALSAAYTWQDAAPAGSHLEGIRLLAPNIQEETVRRMPLPVCQISAKPRRYGVIGNFPLYHQIFLVEPKYIALLVIEPSPGFSISTFAEASRIIEAGGRGDPRKELGAIYSDHMKSPWRTLPPHPFYRGDMADLLGCTKEQLRLREPRL